MTSQEAVDFVCEKLEEQRKNGSICLSKICEQVCDRFNLNLSPESIACLKAAACHLRSTQRFFFTDCFTRLASLCERWDCEGSKICLETIIPYKYAMVH